MLGQTNRQSILPRPIVLVLTTVILGGLVFTGAALAQDAGADQAPGQADDATDQTGNATATVRVVHASPDAPAVDVYLGDAEGEPAVENVTFGTIGEYQDIPVGLTTVTVTEAGDKDAVVFNESLPVPPGTFTVVAAGEVSEEGAVPFQPVILLDEAAAPEAGNALVRLAHLSPDAPAVDVTVAGSNETLFENVSYANASTYQSVPAGNYTLEIRPAGEDGEPIATTNVSVDAGQAYTALAVGYLDAEAAPGNESFRVLVAEDNISGGPGASPGARPGMDGNDTDLPDAPGVNITVAEP